MIFSPWGEGSHSSGNVFAPEAEFPAARAASIPEEHLRPGHLAPTAETLWQARQTRRLCTRSHASGGSEPTLWWTGRRCDIRDGKQPHPVGEAPVHRASRSSWHGTKPHARRLGGSGCPGLCAYSFGHPAGVSYPRSGCSPELSLSGKLESSEEAGVFMFFILGEDQHGPVGDSSQGGSITTCPRRDRRGFSCTCASASSGDLPVWCQLQRRSRVCPDVSLPGGVRPDVSPVWPGKDT